jgi:hypothetical protein
MGRLGIKLNNTTFAKAKEKLKESGDFNDVVLENGRYVCIVRKGRALEAKGNPKLVLDLEVAGEAEQAGGRISVWYTLTDDKMHYLLRDLTKLGYDIAELDEDVLADIIDDLTENNPVVRITAKNNGENVNYYIDKRLDELTAAEVESSGSAADPEAAGGTAGIKEDAPPAKSAKAKATAKAAPAPEPEAEPEPEPEPEPEAEPTLADLDREALKKIAKVEAPDFKIFKATTDDQIREAIMAARGGEPEAEPESEPEPEPEVEIAPGLKCKATIKGKVADVTVVSVDEASGTVVVKTATGNVKIPAAQLSL